MAKFCQGCGAQLANENSQFCDKCGAKLPSSEPTNPVANEPKKESTLNTALKWGAIGCGGIILAMIIAAFVFGMSGNTSPTTTSVSTNVKPNSGTTYAPQATTGIPTLLELTVPSTAENPERQVTVSSVQKTSTYYWTGVSGTKYPTTAKSGNTFIFIDAVVKNIGSDRMYASAGDFSMSDSEGNRYDPAMYSGDDSLGYFTELYKNQKVSGKVLFEVPQTAKSLVLYYDFGNAFSGTKLASWKIN